MAEGKVTEPAQLAKEILRRVGRKAISYILAIDIAIERLIILASSKFGSAMKGKRRQVDN